MVFFAKGMTRMSMKEFEIYLYKALYSNERGGQGQEHPSGFFPENGKTPSRPTDFHLSSVQHSPNEPVQLQGKMPEWAACLSEIMKYNPKAVSELKHPLPHMSFVTFFVPFLLFAQERMSKAFSEFEKQEGGLSGIIDAAGYQDGIMSELHQCLDKLATRTLITELNVAREDGRLKGASPEERYVYFVEQYISDPEIYREFFELYPVLGRLMAEKVLRVLEIHEEIIGRFLSDRSLIAKKFNIASPELVGFEGDLGDSHKNGQSVKVLVLNNGKLVYKPRSLSIDEHYRELLNWLNGRGMKYSLRAAEVLDRGNYGWQEFVKHEGCSSEEELERFYFRQGGHLAILYGLRSVDFHNENIIASGEHPILIDLETLFDNHVSIFAQNQNLHVTALELKHSVLSSMMLPVKFKHDEVLDFDLSGIGGKGGQQSKKAKGYAALNYGEDRMSLKETSLTTEEKLNAPKLNGRPVSAVFYTDFIVEGFKNAYAIMMKHKEELAGPSGFLNLFKHDEVRHVFRPTHVYGKFLEASTHPDYLTAGDKREQLFDYMWMLAKQSEKANVFIPDEIVDLLLHDIPYFTFYAGGTSLLNSRGEESEGFYETSSIDLAKKKIQSFSEKDLNHQLRYISLSMATLIENVWDHAESGLGQKETVADLGKEVKHIADDLLQKAIYSERGEGPFWISNNAGDEKMVFLSPLPMGLYDGMAGLAIFFAQAGKVLNEQVYTDTARSMIEEIQKEESYWVQNGNSHSAFFGTGSFIYLYSYLGSLWEDDSLLERALNLIPRVLDQPNQTQNPDFIAGDSGLLTVLVNLYEIKQHPAVLDSIRQVLSRLNDRIGRLLDSIEQDAVSLTGFSHGLTGIAFSIAKAAKVIHDDSCKELVLKLVEEEDRYFQKDHLNWLDLRNDSHTLSPSYWCHGAPGILLGRAHIQAFIPELTTRTLKLQEALQSSLNLADCQNHSLCHGLIGNLNILLDIKRLNRELHVPDDIFCIYKTKNRGWKTGLHSDVESLGMFVGTAGIAYGLLRLLDESVPSVLTLDIPTGR